MNNPQIIKREWDKFRERCFAGFITPDQLHDYERCFRSGAMAVMGAIIEAAHEGTEDYDKAGHTVCDIRDELLAWGDNEVRDINNRSN